MSQLKQVPPPPDNEYMWKKLMNHLYGCGEDALLDWLRSVRAEVCEKKRVKRAA